MKAKNLFLLLISVFGLAACGISENSDSNSANSSSSSVTTPDSASNLGSSNITITTPISTNSVGSSSVSITTPISTDEGSGSSSISTPDSTGSTGNSGTVPVVPKEVITEWPNDIESAYYSELGEVIPVAPFHEDSLFIDIGEGYVWIIGRGNSTFGDDYEILLIEDDYEYIGISSLGSKCYEKRVHGNTSIYIEVVFDGSEWNVISYLSLSTILVTIEEWSEEIKAALNDKLGEEIPVAPYYDETMIFEVGENYVWIIGMGEETLYDVYSLSLLDDGYEYIGTNDFGFECYEKRIYGNTSIYIEVMFDGLDWNIITYISVSTILETIKKWPEEVEIFMEELFGEVMPSVTFFDDLYMINTLQESGSEEVFGLNIYGYCDGIIAYDDLLTSASFYFHGVESSGFSIYEKELGEGKSIFVDMKFESDEEKTYGYIDLYFYLGSTSRPIPTEWDQELIDGIQEMIGSDSTFELPFIQLSQFYNYKFYSEYGNYVEIIDGLGGNYSDEYAIALTNAGFALDEDYLGTGRSVYLKEVDGKNVVIIFEPRSYGFVIIVEIIDVVITWNSDWFSGFEIDVISMLPPLTFALIEIQDISENNTDLITIPSSAEELMMFELMFLNMYGFIYDEGSQCWKLEIPDSGTLMLKITDYTFMMPGVYIFEITFVPVI